MITVTSYHTPACKTTKGTWHCYSTDEAQTLINQLHRAGHKYVSAKVEG